MKRYDVFQQLYPKEIPSQSHTKEWVANINHVGVTRALNESEAIRNAAYWTQFRTAMKLARFPMVKEIA